jgi:cobalamin biosynthesis Mg chelatase CobN
MGSNVSTQAIEQSQHIIKSTLNTQNTGTDSTLKCDANAKQTITVGSGGDMKMGGDCKIVIGQKSTVSLSCTMKASQQVKTQQGAQATAQLKAMASQKITEANSKLNLGQSNVSVVHSKSDQYLDDNVQNIVNSTIKSTINSSANASQTIDVNFANIDCEGGTLDISQDGILNSISKSSASQLVAGWQKAVGKDVVSALSTQEGKLTNSGISLSIIFVIIGIVVLGVLGLAVYFVTTSEKTAVRGATGLANAASNVTTLSAPNYRGAVPQPQHLGNID